jgi:hypothetical protein
MDLQMMAPWAGDSPSQSALEFADWLGCNSEAVF